MNALILVDLQNDFVPGGALAVPHGDRIVPLLNRLQPRFDLVVATQDWHPADHGSFAANHPGHQPGDRIDLHGLPQILWPVHCVQGSPGADFVPGLDRARWDRVFVKGTDRAIDSYSGFFDNGHRQATGLADYLREKGVTDVYVAGLATDYCVKCTALDARQLGFNTHLIAAACRGVNLQPSDVERAIEEMRAAGVAIVSADDVFGQRNLQEAKPSAANPPMNTDLMMNNDRILGALWGAVVGDALGVPVEFQSRQSLRTNPVTGLRGYGTHRQPAGTWSDDSSLLLCTVDSLTTCRRFDPADLGQRFVRWESFGYWTPHGDVFDVGVATSQAISRLAQGRPPEEAGGNDEYSNGNGSLMRILPVALWFRDLPDEALAAYAQRASSLTHRHLRSQMACALYCLLVKRLLAGANPEDAFEDARKSFSRIYNSAPFVQERHQFKFLENGDLRSAPEMEVDSSGYVIHTLTASIWCLLASGSFEETVLKAVNLGGDTDTTGCVAGGLAGAFYGTASIPHDWKSCLARKEALAALFTQFVDAYQPVEVIAEYHPVAQS